MRVCHLVHSPILDDPRVRRHGDALHAAGWEVHGIGHSGGRTAPPPWQVTELDHHSLAGRTRAIHGVRSALTRLLPRTASATFWNDRRNTAMYDAARTVNADLYVANDWDTLPIAAALAEDHGTPFVYDSHEYWPEAGIHRREWRYVIRPLIVAVEREYAPRAAGVTTVSHGIAERMRENLGLDDVPTVVRNVTSSPPAEFRPTGDHVDVLYHGVFAETRRIRETIEMAPFLPDGWTVTVRGPHEGSAYGKSCADAAERTGGRARLQPPVPSSELVARATESDLGMVIRNVSTAEHEFALPNKLFEFFAAGLGVVVSDHSEQAALVEQYGAGIVVPRHASPRQMAARLAELTPADIDRYKRGSIAAGADLTWERESETYLRAIDAALGAGRA